VREKEIDYNNFKLTRKEILRKIFIYGVLALVVVGVVILLFFIGVFSDDKGSTQNNSSSSTTGTGNSNCIASDSFESVLQQKEFPSLLKYSHENFGKYDLVFLYRKALYLSDICGREQAQLGGAIGVVGDFLINPDGEKVYYSKELKEGRSRVYEYDLKTGREEEIIGAIDYEFKNTENGALEHKIEGQDIELSFIDFSDSGNEFIYARDGIWKYDLVTKKSTKLYDEYGYSTEGDWKGDYLTLTGAPDGEAEITYVFEVKSEKLVRLEDRDLFWYGGGQSSLGFRENGLLYVHDDMNGDNDCIDVDILNVASNKSQTLVKDDTCDYKYNGWAVNHSGELYVMTESLKDKKHYFFKVENDELVEVGINKDLKDSGFYTFKELIFSESGELKGTILLYDSKLIYYSFETAKYSFIANLNADGSSSGSLIKVVHLSRDGINSNGDVNNNENDWLKYENNDLTLGVRFQYPSDWELTEEFVEEEGSDKNIYKIKVTSPSGSVFHHESRWMEGFGPTPACFVDEEEQVRNQEIAIDCTWVKDNEGKILFGRHLDDEVSEYLAVWLVLFAQEEFDPGEYYLNPMSTFTYELKSQDDLEVLDDIMKTVEYTGVSNL
jgi:hypothetical protein